MKFKLKSALVICLLLGALIFITGCTPEDNPYKGYDEDDFNVTVRFDAGDGTFMDNVSVVADTFNISGMKTNANGKVVLPLLSPTDTARGDRNYYPNLGKGDCFLVGWYTQRTENPDGEGYTYSGLWDFKSNKLELDPNVEYSSADPVLTLYAAWAPKLSVEFVDVTTGESNTISYDPNNGSIIMPSWDMKTGTLQMGKIPAKKNYTFDRAFYDEGMTQLVDTAELKHSATVDYSTGTVTNPSMKIYVNWKEGNWYRIYTAKQFRDLASTNGNYEIMADLDFEGKWSTTFMHGKFNGTIVGNGHTFKNIAAEQINNDKTVSGLFGNLTSTAKISDLKFENVSFFIKAGTRKLGSSFGLFAGQISEGATITNVQVLNSVLKISSNITYSDQVPYIVGRVCGIGYDPSIMDSSGIRVEAVNEEPSAGATTYKVVEIEEIDGNMINVSVKTVPVEQTPSEAPSEPIS